MFKITNKIITTRVNVSLNNFPPIILGKLTYHAEIAVKYQTFTNVCPKLQNNVRLSITLTVSVHPKAQGISIRTRSEEHTSELQSRGHLVCRLMLEKKK